MKSTLSDDDNNAIFGTSYVAGNLSRMTAGPPTTTLHRAKSTDKTKKLLPADFQPSEYSVICGNKRAFFNSVGNRRFRVICQMHVAEFMNAPSKHEKSVVVTKVMKTLRDACPVGTFVSFEKGRWWEVSDRTSREKVGTFFRDCLSDTYKSSSKNKIAQRKKKRYSFQASPQNSPVPSMMPMVADSAPVPSIMPMASNSQPHSLTPFNPVAAPMGSMDQAPIFTLPLTVPNNGGGPRSLGVGIQSVGAASINPVAALLASLNTAPVITPPLNAPSNTAPTINPTLNAPCNTAPILNPTLNAPSNVRVARPSVPVGNDEDSLGSSSGSFYDVNDLTPMSI